RDCKRYFTINLGFERMRATPQIITSALQLYFTGESFRNVQKFLKLQGVNINHNTIYRWIKKYVTLMKAYLEKITPNVADAWRADELYLKVRGNPKYLFALKGKTPAEKCGIIIEGPDKWKTVIENASKLSISG
ncbi:MAG: hypothetical protein WAM14_03565, partial [Candidatus Nitrosopolaris sp.]